MDAKMEAKQISEMKQVALLLQSQGFQHTAFAANDTSLAAMALSSWFNQETNGAVINYCGYDFVQSKDQVHNDASDNFLFSEGTIVGVCQITFKNSEPGYYVTSMHVAMTEEGLRNDPPKYLDVSVFLDRARITEGNYRGAIEVLDEMPRMTGIDTQGGHGRRQKTNSGPQ